MWQNFTTSLRKAVFRAAKLAGEQKQEISVWHLATAALDAHNDAYVDATRISADVLKDQDTWNSLAPTRNDSVKKRAVLTRQAKKTIDVACLEARHIEPSKQRRLLWLFNLGPTVNTTCVLIGCLVVDPAIAAYFLEREVTIDALRQALGKGVFESEA